MENSVKGEAQQKATGRLLTSKTSARWPNGVVPYTLDAAFDSDYRAIIASAITTMGESTCIKWRPKEDSDKDWVYIQTTGASGCTGQFGFARPGYGQHNLKLEGPTACKDKGVVLHEMMHNLGVNHEHQRPDRDTKITMDWSNLQLDKADNFWKTQWATDTTTIPKCTLEGKSQGADFSGCVEEGPVTDFGVGYDIKSIMHYQPSFFTVDKTKGVFSVNDGTTDIGGSEMTAMDILKLKKAYGCDGSCGAWQKSQDGADLTGAGGDAKSPCEWILETSPGKGIQIDIEQITGATTDCATNYLEVRLGSKPDGQLVGKFCSTAGTLKVNNFLLWVKWVRPADTAAAATLTAKWTTYDFSCCPKILLEGLDGQSDSAGTYMKTKTFNNRNVYKQEGGANYLYFAVNQWNVGSQNGGEPTNAMSTGSIGVRTKGAEFCPEETSLKWEYYGNVNGAGAWVEDADAKLRCSDCAKFPAADECATCCDDISMTSTFEEFKQNCNLADCNKFYSQIYGDWKAEAADFNGHKIYKSVKNADYCLYFSNRKMWTIYACSGKEGGSTFLTAGSNKCVRQTTKWEIFSQTTGQTVASDLAFSCKGGNPVPPTAAPQATTTMAAPPPPGATTRAPAAQCLPCKSITTGPTELQGTYILDKGNTDAPRSDCKDSCVYKKGEETFCFAAGGFPVDTC